MKIGSERRKTWTEFMADVGGLLGVVLGMGIVSFVELFWLCCRLCSNKFGYEAYVT